MTIGNLVKTYRQEHDLPMQEFADRCGLSKSYISMLEKNINPRNNKPIIPTIETYKKIARGMNIDLDSLLKILDSTELVDLSKVDTVPIEACYIIPVLGRVAAGYGKEVVEEVIGQIEISPSLASKGDYFGLLIKGDSMIPTLYDCDTVIVERTDDAESGDLVIALVNGSDATCKRLQKYAEGIALIPQNPAYEPMRFTDTEIDSTPVKILGKVIEMRRKF